jgi:hypothetical protein
MAVGSSPRIMSPNPAEIGWKVRGAGVLTPWPFLDIFVDIIRVLGFYGLASLFAYKLKSAALEVRYA